MHQEIHGYLILTGHHRHLEIQVIRQEKIRAVETTH